MVRKIPTLLLFVVKFSVHINYLVELKIKTKENAVQRLVLWRPLVATKWMPCHAARNIKSKVRPWTSSTLAVMDKWRIFTYFCRNIHIFLYIFSVGKYVNISFVTNSYVVWFFSLACAFLKRTELKKKTLISCHISRAGIYFMLQFCNI